MKEKKWVWFSVFRKVLPADYEKWLEEMAAQGWHLDRVGQWSSILMIFKKGAPQKLRFVFDLQARPGRNYKQIYTDFGWEFVGQMASVFIWKMPYGDKRPEAFTDPESVIQSILRVTNAILVSFILMVLGVLGLFVPQIFFSETLAVSDKIQLWSAQILFLLLAAFLGAIIIHIRRKSS